jgi:hypothetical protein
MQPSALRAAADTGVRRVSGYGALMTKNTWPRDQYNGPDGGLYNGPGGGMYNGPCENPYRSNIPPWPVFIEYLKQNGMHDLADLIKSHMG